MSRAQTSNSTPPRDYRTEDMSWVVDLLKEIKAEHLKHKEKNHGTAKAS